MSSAEGGRSPLRYVLYGAILLAIVVALMIERSSIDRPGTAELTVEVSFPATAAPGTVETAVITATNSGAAPVETLFVSFSLVGVGGEAGVPRPLVAAVAGDRSTVVAVRPEPAATGGGVRFGFGPLAAGESTTIEFDLRIPGTRGTAANSVQVYDGRDPDVAAGARLTTEVQ